MVKKSGKKGNIFVLTVLTWGGSADAEILLLVSEVGNTNSVKKREMLFFEGGEGDHTPRPGGMRGICHLDAAL